MHLGTCPLFFFVTAAAGCLGGQVSWHRLVRPGHESWASRGPTCCKRCAVASGLAAWAAERERARTQARGRRELGGGGFVGDADPERIVAFRLVTRLHKAAQ